MYIIFYSFAVLIKGTFTMIECLTCSSNLSARSLFCLNSSSYIKALAVASDVACDNVNILLLIESIFVRKSEPFSSFQAFVELKETTYIYMSIEIYFKDKLYYWPYTDRQKTNPCQTYQYFIRP